MKILFIQPTSDKRGHYGIWTTRICQELGKLGHNITLCTNKVFPEKYVKEKLLFTIFEIKGGKLGFEKFDAVANKWPLYYFYGYYRNSLQIMLAGLRLARKKDFDVIFIADAEFLTSTLLLKLFGCRIPPVAMQVNAANFSFSAYSGSIIKKLYKVLQREIFKLTLGREIRAFAVLGQWHKEQLQHQLKLDDDFPVAVIPDGGAKPACVLERSEARNKIGVDFDRDLLLAFGVLRKDKDIETLFEAVSKISGNHFRLLVAGAPMEYSEDEIRNMVDKWRISDKVILHLKYISDEELPVYFLACDVVVLSYKKIYTGGSGPLMKGACTYRRPVVVTGVSEMGRLAKGHKIGLVAEPQNPQDLAEKIEDFFSLSSTVREEMSRNAFNLAKANSWDAMALKYTTLFEGIIKNSNV